MNSSKESKETVEQKEIERKFNSDDPDMNAICADCGKPFGKHHGAICPYDKKNKPVLATIELPKLMSLLCKNGYLTQVAYDFSKMQATLFTTLKKADANQIAREVLKNNQHRKNCRYCKE